MYIIGLNGMMGSGKSTAAEMIQSLSDRPTVLVKFAQPLYDMQELIYDRIKEAYVRPPSFVKDRKLLQWLGTEWGRETISFSIWLDLWRAKVLQAVEAGNNVICDDVRFNNEAAILKSMGGHLLQIKSKAAVDRMRVLRLQGLTGHASETGIHDKYVDRVINNDYTLDELRADVAGSLKHFGIISSTQENEKEVL